MSVNIKNFGVSDGRDVHLIALENNNLKAEFLTYGGIIRSLEYKGIDVVLGRDTLEEYIDNDGYLGALIGRNSNRIAEGRYTLNGTEYNLYINNGTASLHGGKVGFNAKVWNYEIADESEPKLKLSLFSPDMEENYPGNLKVEVTYTLKCDNSLEISYYAACDKDTIVNMTNHSYFNLNGHASGNIYGHKVMLNCDFYTPNCADCFPNGEILSVKDTPFDFTSEKTFNDALHSDHEQIVIVGGGIDHNFIINGKGMRKFCEATGDKTCIKLEGFTDNIGVQIYTSNFLDGSRPGKDGYAYEKHAGFCLETQGFPNAINYPHFPSPVLKQGQEYKTKTIFKFN